LGYAALVAMALFPSTMTRADSIVTPDASTYAGQATLPTNVVGVHAFAAPPAGFNPLSATPQQLAQYGLPQAPDPRAAPDQYQVWAQAMQAATVYVRPFFTPHPEIRADIPTTSSNWSGTAITGSYNSFREVQGQWVVPNIDTSSVAGAMVVTWVGIDGYGNGRVEQDGSLGWASPSGPYYCAWTELYPLQGILCSNLSVKPGQTIYTYMTTNASSTYFFMENTNTGNYISFTEAGGCLCQTAEWITERPSNGSVPYPLARFGTVVMTDEGASSGTTDWWAHTSPYTTYRINMVGSTGKTLVTTTNLGIYTDMMTWHAYN
jgi:hypothetical protein